MADSSSEEDDGRGTLESKKARSGRLKAHRSTSPLDLIKSKLAPVAQRAINVAESLTGTDLDGDGDVGVTGRLDDLYDRNPLEHSPSPTSPADASRIGPRGGHKKQQQKPPPHKKAHHGFLGGIEAVACKAENFVERIIDIDLDRDGDVGIAGGGHANLIRSVEDLKTFDLLENTLAAVEARRGFEKDGRMTVALAPGPLGVDLYPGPNFVGAMILKFNPIDGNQGRAP